MDNLTELFKPLTDQYGAYLRLGGQLCLLFFVVFTVALVFWTFRDAQRRGAMSALWALVVLVFNVFGWMIYMVVRPPEYADDALERELEIRAREAELQRGGAACPSCLKPIAPDYLICPYCMKKLKKQCVSCGKPLKMSWAVCPYCKAKQQVADALPATETPAPKVPRAPKPPEPQS
jgi:hypothetical protein